jgi:hypothetical protein
MGEIRLREYADLKRDDGHRPGHVSETIKGKAESLLSLE